MRPLVHSIMHFGGQMFNIASVIKFSKNEKVKLNGKADQRNTNIGKEAEHLFAGVRKNESKEGFRRRVISLEDSLLNIDNPSIRA